MCTVCGCSDLVTADGKGVVMRRPLVVLPTLDDDFETVVQTARRQAVQVLEGPHVLAHGRFHVLLFREVQILPPNSSAGS